MSERLTMLSYEFQEAIQTILRQQEIRGERVVNHIRLAFSIVGLLAMIPAWSLNTTLTNMIFTIQGLCWLVYSLALYVLLANSDKHYWAGLKFVTITLDILLLATNSVATAVNHSGFLEYFSSIWPFLFVYWTIFAGFRISLAAGVYAAALSFVVNMGILWYAVATGMVETTGISDYQGRAINIDDQVIVNVFISMPGVVAGIIARMGRNLVLKAEEESLQRARLEKEKARLGKYLSRDLVEMVLEDPDRLELGGSRKVATIMFTNIRNFTPFSESREPEEVVNFLNLYFTRMVSIVFDTGGTLDKYMGDGLLAEYGVPFDVTRAPLRAVVAALEMIEGLHSFDREGKRELSEIEIAVGIATGPVVAGNIGSLERMEYTCIGDTVNMAAGLEKLNRQIGTNIILCEKTYEAVKGYVPAHRLPPMKLKGQPTTVFYALKIPENTSALIRRLRNEMNRPDSKPIEAPLDSSEDQSDKAN